MSLSKNIREAVSKIPKPDKKINPHIFTFTVWGGILLIIIATSMNRDESVFSVVFMLSGFVSIIFGWIYSLLCLARCWEVIQGFTARTTPGKAVGFLFIPFFNLYWVFVSLNGLAKDANEFLKNGGVDKKINEGLSTATGVISIIPYINVLSPIFINILIYQWADFYETANLNWDKLSTVQSFDQSKEYKSDNTVAIILATCIGGIMLIGILAAIAIPQFIAYRERGYCMATKTDLKNAYTSAQALYSYKPNANISNLHELEEYGLTLTKDVNIEIINGHANDLKMRSKHSNCKKTYYMDSAGNISEE